MYAQPLMSERGSCLTVSYPREPAVTGMVLVAFTGADVEWGGQQPVGMMTVLLARACGPARPTSEHSNASSGR